MFISFEGIDGSGKSTQARAFVEYLRDQGHDVVATREPGGSTGAEEIRELVLTGDANRWSPETEILLFTAARRDHVERCIRPALEAGKIVVTDRFADSTRVYQGCTRKDLLSKVDLLHDTMIGIDPDITFVIDMPAEKGLSRGLARDTKELRFEDMGLDLQQRAREMFLQFAASAPRYEVIDGDASPHEVTERLITAFNQRLKAPA